MRGIKLRLQWTARSGVEGYSSPRVRGEGDQP